jgi:ribonuclease J
MRTQAHKTRLVIHKGTSEIGGTCIELSRGEGTLLLDIGLPLAEGSVPVDLKNIKPQAVVVSHPHQDHYGLIETLDHGVPVFMGELSRNLIEAARLFRHEEPLENNFKYFKAWVPFQACGFTITPYLVDHSAADAYAFLVEDGEHRLFYSGDFRAHGRKSILFEKIVSDPLKDIDVLVMEGSMLNRDNGSFPSEVAVEQEIGRILKRQKTLSFLIASAQNIDRVVSAFKACRDNGKTLVVDVYGAWVLEQLKLVSENVPNISWPEVGVYVQCSQYETVKENRAFFGKFARDIFHGDCRVTLEMLDAEAEMFLFMTRLSGWRFIRSGLGTDDIHFTPLIYSQWLGYLDEDNWGIYGAREMAELRDDTRVQFIYAHTSGHATVVDLHKFASALAPRMLVPIHTEFRNEFEKYFDNVLVLDDGQELIL